MIEVLEIKHLYFCQAGSFKRLFFSEISFQAFFRGDYLAFPMVITNQVILSYVNRDSCQLRYSNIQR